MKTTHNILVFSILNAGILLVSVFHARSQEGTWYVKADLGGNVTRDVKMNEFFGLPVAPGSKLQLDPGVRAGFAGGYQFTDWFSAEGELGVFANRVNSITGATEVHEASFGNIPVLVNGKLQLPNPTPFTPYIGAGIGFSEAFLDARRIAYPDGAGGTVFVRGSDADTVFAWQALAGLRYAINKRMGLSVEYRYFRADGGEWRADFAPGAPSDRIRFGRTETHAVSLAFDVHF
ncbi:MAG TPA: outer membrane beta-barrel protein [Candidatus Binatia bacterium]|jgi:opacity protein-like surface antigen|nr:outer membrane beta-barrel protein [Candidatus Binatia bacterium]